MKKVIEIIIYTSIVAAFLRGLFVFDQGGSAAGTYPEASAICFIGSIFAAIYMLSLRNKGNGQ
jgi:hypothetical protein